MASIAEIWVEVLPSTAKIADGIKKALREVDDDVRAAAKRWRHDIDRESTAVDDDEIRAAMMAAGG